MIPTLIPKQYDALPHIRWLISEYCRAEGRTYLLAIAFIEEAIKTNRSIIIFDHFGGYPQTSRNMLPMIKELYFKYYKKNWNLIINKDNMTIKMLPRFKATNQWGNDGGSL